ncbi:MAG: hypothetical protein V1777_02690 [Candidatus Micrarchaeota archaeon]
MPPKSATHVWKSVADVKRVWFVRKQGKEVTLNQGGEARIILGRVLFKDGKRHPIAIKYFHTPIKDSVAERYTEVIEKLRAAKVRTAKMAMMKIPTERSPNGEWVQISEAFGSNFNKIKLNPALWGDLQTIQQKTAAMTELCKIAKAGLYPAIDAIEGIQGKNEAIVVDIGSLIKLRTPARCAQGLFFAISMMTADIHERSQLIQYVSQSIRTNPELFEPWKTLIAK